MVTDAEDPSRLKPNAAGTSRRTVNAVRRPLHRVPEDPPVICLVQTGQPRERFANKSDSYALPAVSRTVLAIDGYLKP